MINFDCCNLHITDDNGNQILLSNHSTATFNVETSSNEVAPISCNLTSTAEFSFDTKLEAHDILSPSEFTINWKTRILIQARWHKKARVNKKWLKRYGIKDDTVKVVAKVDQVTYDASDSNWNFELRDYKRILRPDQMAKGRMIWWSANL